MEETIMAEEIRYIEDPGIRSIPDPSQGEMADTFLGKMPLHPGFPLELPPDTPEGRQEMQRQLKKSLLSAASMAAGGVPGAIGKGLETIPYVGGAISRILPQAAIGAAGNDQNRLQGALAGGGTQAALESLPFVGKALAKTAEYVKPKEFVKNLSNNIKQVYETSMKAASDEFEPVLKEVGSKNIRKGKTSDEFSNVGDDIRQYFSPDIKKLSEKYLKDPLFENAHDLQSQIGTRMGKLRRGEQDAATMNAIEGLKIARDALRRDQLNYLEKINPELSKKYLKGTEITREIIGPFRRDPEIFKIAEGAKKEIEPNKLLTSLKKVQEKHFTEKKEPLSDSHFLSEALSKLEPKIQRGKAAQLGIDLGIGALGGFATGVGPGAMEAVASKFLTPKILEASTNPEIQKLATALMKYSQPIGRTTGNYLLQRQQ
jgi:hypothetical protein